MVCESQLGLLIAHRAEDGVDGLRAGVGFGDDFEMSDGLHATPYAGADQRLIIHDQ